MIEGFGIFVIEIEWIIVQCQMRELDCVCFGYGLFLMVIYYFVDFKFFIYLVFRLEDGGVFDFFDVGYECFFGVNVMGMFMMVLNQIDCIIFILLDMWMLRMCV